MDDKATSKGAQEAIGKGAAEIFFAVLMLILSLTLLSMIQDQVTYSSDKPIFKQPGLWSAIGLVGMSVSSIFYLIVLWLRRSAMSKENNSLTMEVWIWLRSLEFLCWFMVYVYLVPIVGYLPTTVLFSLVLLFRLGYREKKILLASVATSFSIVIIFKSLLQVKIPGGALYESLPEFLRNFFIVYL